jgi:fused signal recognition particle receptor
MGRGGSYAPRAMDASEISLIRAAALWVRDNLPVVVAVSLLAPLFFALVVEWLGRSKAAAKRVDSGTDLEAATSDLIEPERAVERAAEREASESGLTPSPPRSSVAAEPFVVEEVAPAAPSPASVAVPVPEQLDVSESESVVRVSLRERLSRTSESFFGRVGGLLGGRKVDADLLDELEAMMFGADLGVATAESLLAVVKQKASGASGEVVKRVLHQAVLERLQRVEPRGERLPVVGKPHVILVLGVNGTGKTTTIGKLAARYARAGRTVVLGAGDTFRAAAIEQLQVWGERVGCEVVAGKQGGDPASVAFDAVKTAIARNADVCIVDTAGRLQTKKPLMDELGKIVRVLSRDLPDAPHETLLVLDSNTGQNAISQAELFTEVANVTGLVLTKLDGSAKGGVIVGLADRFGIPVQYVGVGETIDDLRDFEAKEFVDALFGLG